MTAWMLTWLWQGVALTLTVALVLKAKRLNASTRHVIWWSALVAVIWLGCTSSPYRSLEPIRVSMEAQVRGQTPMAWNSRPSRICSLQSRHRSLFLYSSGSGLRLRR